MYTNYTEILYLIQHFILVNIKYLKDFTSLSVTTHTSTPNPILYTEYNFPQLQIIQLCIRERFLNTPNKLITCTNDAGYYL